VAEASADLSARKAPVLFGWAEQVRAIARPATGRRPDTGGRSGEIGRGPHARVGGTGFLRGGWRGTRHQSPCSGRRPDGRRNPVLKTCQPD